MILGVGIPLQLIINMLILAATFVLFIFLCIAHWLVAEWVVKRFNINL